MKSLLKLLCVFSLVAVVAWRTDAQAQELNAPIPPDLQLVVADQRQQLQVAFDVSGEGKRLPFKVKFADFRGGPAILESFRGKALDLAVVGDGPPIQAQASGTTLPIVAARLSSEVAYQYALSPGFKGTRLADLKGRKIAYAEGTAAQTFVLSTLAKLGLSKKDVILVPLRIADFSDAVRSGAVDAAPLNEPPFTRYLTSFRAEGAHALPPSELEGLPLQLSFFYASESALKDVEKATAIRIFLEHWVRAVQWTEVHREAWLQAYYVKSQGLGLETGRIIDQSQGTFSYPPLSRLIERQQKTADLIHAAGDIPKKLDVRAAFDLRFEHVTENAAASKPR